MYALTWQWLGRLLAIIGVGWGRNFLAPTKGNGYTASTWLAHGSRSREVLQNLNWSWVGLQAGSLGYGHGTHSDDLRLAKARTIEAGSGAYFNASLNRALDLNDSPLVHAIEASHIFVSHLSSHSYD